MAGRDPGGCIITILLGVAGASVGGFLYSLLTNAPFVAEPDLGDFAATIVDSVVPLLPYRAAAGRRACPPNPRQRGTTSDKAPPPTHS